MKYTEAITRADLEAVWRLRYSEYIEHDGREMVDADHEQRLFADSLDSKSHVLCAHDDGELCGSVRVALTAETDLGSYSRLYRLRELGPTWKSESSITSRLVVHNERRGSMLALALCREACRFLTARGVRFNVIDAFPELRELYLALGFRDLGLIEHPTNGRMHLMAFDRDDHAHHERVRSPLRRICLASRALQSA